jgi:hypothetical protein
MVWLSCAAVYSAIYECACHSRLTRCCRLVRLIVEQVAPAWESRDGEGRLPMDCLRARWDSPSGKAGRAGLPVAFVAELVTLSSSRSVCTTVQCWLPVLHARLFFFFCLI